MNTQNMVQDMPRTPQNMVPVMIRLPPETISKIDEWRRHEKDLPARSEAMRRLFDIAFASLAAPEERLKRKAAKASQEDKK